MATAPGRKEQEPPNRPLKLTPHAGENVPGVSHSPTDREGGARIRITEDR